MVFKFEQFVSLQRKKTFFILLTYVFTIVLAIYLMLVLSAKVSMFFSILLSLLMALGIGWFLTKTVDYFVQVHCPNCSSSQLTENFTLQCKMPEYQCDQCQRVYSVESVQ